VRGSGIFTYYVPPKKGDELKVPPELDGKFALEESTELGDWHCVKQMDVPPKLDSIDGTNPVEPTSKGDRWQ
jgi:hypothetical protein